MKSNIDLTENNDFNIENFKRRAVKSKYYDNVNGDSSRLPWNKEGKLYENHKVLYRWMNDFGTTLSWTNLNNNSTTFTYRTSTDWASDLLWDTYNTSWTVTNTSNMYNGYISTWGDNNATMHLSYQYLTQSDAMNKLLIDDILYHKSAYVDVKGNGFRLGKVESIKNTYIAKEDHYYHHRRKTPWLYSDVYKSENISNHIKYSLICRSIYQSSGIFGKNKNNNNVYNGYDNPEIYIDEFKVGHYRSLDDRQKERYGLTLCDILVTYRDEPDYIYKHHKHKEPKRQFGWYDDSAYEKNKINWPDFHDDYIREMEGMTPRNDWRHGIKGNSRNTLLENAIDSIGFAV